MTIQKLRITLVFLFLGCFFGTCTEKNPMPSLSEDKLVQVLMDVHFAEAAMNNIYGNVKDSLAEIYYEQIYAIHQIDSNLLKEQIAALRKNPIYMETIYEKVEKEIELKEVAEKKKR